MKIRTNRMAEELKKEIVGIIRNNLKDPRVDGLVSVTAVEVTADLKYAKVYISKLGSDYARNEALEGLKASKGFIRSELGKRFKTHTVPELTFVLDESLEYGAKIEAILHKINEDSKDNETQETVEGNE